MTDWRYLLVIKEGCAFHKSRKGERMYDGWERHGEREVVGAVVEEEGELGGEWGE